MITLQNPGEIEIELITTMGANVKESSTALGQFGTGLKYAIAVFLREKIDVELYIGTNRFQFHTITKTLRGKNFDMCYMRSKFDSIALGFTTELGKNWSFWQAYREIYTNCVIDEKGVVDLNDPISPREGFTTFRINIAQSEELENVFLRDMNIPLIYSSDDIDVYDCNSEYLYYQGIRAKDLYKKSMYTYNLKRYCTLTEDRQIAYDHRVSEILSDAILEMQDEKLIEPLLNALDKYYESKIDFTMSTKTPSDAFKTVYLTSPAIKRNSTASSIMKHHEPKEPESEEHKKSRFRSELTQLFESYGLDVDGTIIKMILALF